MRNDPVFDPIFNAAPPHDGEEERAAPQRMLFDGWSYEPIATARKDVGAAGMPGAGSG